MILEARGCKKIGIILINFTQTKNTFISFQDYRKSENTVYFIKEYSFENGISEHHLYCREENRY